MVSRLLILFSIIFLFSCKKDRLKDDKEIFIGKWKWVYTKSSHRSNCDNPTIVSYYTPITEGKNYEIEFIKKGCVRFYENETEQEKYRIVFTNNGWELVASGSYSGYYNFNIMLNNKEDLFFAGYVNNDTLIVNGFFPKESSNLGCLSNINYFVRE